MKELTFKETNDSKSLAEFSKGCMINLLCPQLLFSVKRCFHKHFLPLSIEFKLQTFVANINRLDQSLRICSEEEFIAGIILGF